MSIEDAVRILSGSPTVQEESREAQRELAKLQAQETTNNKNPDFYIKSSLGPLVEALDHSKSNIEEFVRVVYGIPENEPITDKAIKFTAKAYTPTKAIDRTRKLTKDEQKVIYNEAVEMIKEALSVKR